MNGSGGDIAFDDFSLGSLCGRPCEFCDTDNVSEEITI